jgi:hypothetical protein
MSSNPRLVARRLHWLLRRLSRIYPAEVPYRISTVLRVMAQSRGFGDARRVPPRQVQGSFGRPWSGDIDAATPTSRDQLLAAAGALMAGDLRVLGRPVPMQSGVPDWNRDPVTGAAMPLGFGLLFDPRHVSDDIDIKYLWEVNRHLWWVTLAQAYATSGEDAIARRLAALIDDWTAACPYPQGPNWTSPVEHGIRLINWSLVWHCIGGERSPVFAGEEGLARRDRWLDSIYQHARFARDNYSFYSSADNHLIGEAAGIYVAARTWPIWTELRRLGDEARTILEREALRQFAADGVNLEQAFCYHKFALQFLLAAGLCGRANDDDFPAAFWQRIEAGLVFLASVMDCHGRVPPVGDGDDSDVFRLWHSSEYQSHRALLELGARLFPESPLSTKCAALGWSDAVGGAQAAEAMPTDFRDGGYLVLGRDLHAADEVRVLFDVGPLGFNRVAGHGHADALSVLVSHRGRDVVVDPGTYCYNSSPEMRRHFRGTAAHNTVVVDGRDQADYGSSFLWLTDVSTTLRSLQDDGSRVSAEAGHDGYRRLPDPVTHLRRVTLDRDRLVIEVVDWLECRREHEMQVHWHFAPDVELQLTPGGPWRFAAEGLRGEVEVSGTGLRAEVARGARNPAQGWVSPRFGGLQEAPVLVVSGRLGAGERVTTRFRLMGQG